MPAPEGRAETGGRLRSEGPGLAGAPALCDSAAMAVHYCGLCRRSAFTGRRHLYSAGHRRRLREALAQLQEATAAARAAAAVADGAAVVRRYDPAEHDGRVWCPCCGRAVLRDGRRGGLALLQAGLMQHLAGCVGWNEAG